MIEIYIALCSACILKMHDLFSYIQLLFFIHARENMYNGGINFHSVVSRNPHTTSSHAWKCSYNIKCSVKILEQSLICDTWRVCLIINSLTHL